MTFQETLLDDPSPWESAVEQTSAERWPLPWELLRTLHNADKIPADKLAILAWALSVDIWDEAWSVEKKRSVVRNSIRDHSLKGTIAGVRRYLSIEDSDLVMYLAPPQRTYASRTLSKVEYEAWLATMPELRIYLQSKPGDGRGLAFAGEDGFAGDGFAMFDQAAAYYGRFPVLIDQGVTTPLRTSETLTSEEARAGRQVERISTPGIGGFSFVGADFVGESFVEHTIKPAEIYTISTDRGYLHRESVLSLNTATVGLQPINVRFTRESEIGNAGATAHVGDFADGPYFVEPDNAAWMLYDRLYLLAPDRAAPVIDALSFAGHSRISMSPFHSEYMVDAHTSASQVPDFEGEFVGSLFARTEDLRKIDRAMDAVALAKGYRDKALVTFETTRPRTWGDGLPLNGSVPIRSRVNSAL